MVLLREAKGNNDTLQYLLPYKFAAMEVVYTPLNKYFAQLIHGSHTTQQKHNNYGL